MANFSIVANSKFQPFTFEELMQPYLAYKQDYEAKEKELGDLMTKANVWAGMASEENDPLAYARYKAYSDNLQNLASDMAAKGLAPGTKSALLAMKADYSKRITPIEEAYKRKNTLATEQRQGRAKGLIYDYDADTTSLDDFMMGKGDYKSIDLNALYTKSKETFSALATQLDRYYRGEDVDPYTETFVKEFGVPRQEIAAFLTAARSGKLQEYAATNPNSRILTGMYNSLYNSTGVQDWNNKLSERQVSDTILQGVGHAMGKADVGTLENFYSRSMLNLDNELAKIKAQKEEPPTPPSPFNNELWEGALEGSGLGELGFQSLSILGGEDPNTNYSSYQTVQTLKNGRKVYHDPMAVKEFYDHLYKEAVSSGSVNGVKISNTPKELEKYRKEEIKKGRKIKMSDNLALELYKKKVDEAIKEAMKDKFGTVTKLLSDDQYKYLTLIGWNAEQAKDTGHSFNGRGIKNAMDNVVQASSLIGIKVTDPEQQGNKIRKRIISRGKKLRAYRVDPSKYILGSNVSYEDIYGDDKKALGTNQIAPGGLKLPGMIVITTDNGMFAYPYKEALSLEAAQQLEAYEEEARRSTNATTRNRILNVQAAYLRSYLSSFNQVEGSTSSYLNVNGKP